MKLLERTLPDYQFVETHRMRVSASPEQAVAAALAAAPGEMVFVRMLFALRSLPPRLVGRGRLPADPGRPLVEQALEFGFVSLGRTEREAVLGFVGQPWRLTGGSMPRIASADEWLAFAEPGYVKAALGFWADPVGDGARLTTETRVQATDEASRRRFARYWLVVRPGSGLIRRSWLRAAKRRAELVHDDLDPAGGAATAGRGSGPRS